MPDDRRENDDVQVSYGLKELLADRDDRQARRVNELRAEMHSGLAEIKATQATKADIVALHASLHPELEQLKQLGVAQQEMLKDHEDRIGVLEQAHLWTVRNWTIAEKLFAVLIALMGAIAAILVAVGAHI